MKKMRVELLTPLVAVLLSSCFADKASVQARAGAPEPAQVAAFSIPYQEGLPHFVLAVEPLQFADRISEWVDKDQWATKRNSSSGYHRDDRKDYGNTSDVAGSGQLHDRGGDRSFSNDGEPAAKQPQSPRTDSQQQQRSSGIWKVSDTDEPAEAQPEKKGSIKESYQDLTVQGKGTKVDRGTAINHSGGGSKEQTQVTTTRDRYQAQKVTTVDRQAHEIAAQMVSALASVKNFAVRDIRNLKQLGSGRYEAQLREGEVGPFVVRALVTEYEVRVVEESSKVNALTLVKTKNDLQEGVVGLDVTVVDGRTGEIAAAFPVQGTFSSRNDKFSTGVIIPFYERKQFIQSVLAQAQRVALNEAAKKTFEALAEKTPAK